MANLYNSKHYINNPQDYFIGLKKRSIMNLKQKTKLIVERFEKEYPLPECTLNFDNAWQLIVAVRLAAQCTDKRVNIVTEQLFKDYTSPEQLAAADIEDIELAVKTCGLYKTKARDISLAMNMLVYEYGGTVPNTMEQLLKIPGIGRKSANLILGDVFNLPAIVVDTHCIRITNRLGLVNSKNPEAIEKKLKEIVAPEKGNDFCHRLVMHGRAVCTARTAFCDNCCLKELCKHQKSLSKA